MGVTWSGLLKLGGDGQRICLIEMEPNEVVHNKLVRCIYISNCSRSVHFFILFAWKELMFAI